MNASVGALRKDTAFLQHVLSGYDFYIPCFETSKRQIPAVLKVCKKDMRADNVVILMHDIDTSKRAMQKHAEEFKGQGFDVLLFNFYGYKAHEKRDADIQTMVDDIYSVVDYVDNMGYANIFMYSSGFSTIPMLLARSVRHVVCAMGAWNPALIPVPVFYENEQAYNYDLPNNLDVTELFTAFAGANTQHKSVYLGKVGCVDIPFYACAPQIAEASCQNFLKYLNKGERPKVTDTFKYLRVRNLFLACKGVAVAFRAIASKR